jgi:SNF2 family DNA or RNA helicase
MALLTYPPFTRSEFLRSPFYLSAVTFQKRNEQRLKHIRELLEKVEDKHRQEQHQHGKPRKNYISTWKILDGGNDATSGKSKNRKEEEAILAEKDKNSVDWVLHPNHKEYTLTYGGIQVMSIPTDMYQRLKPFQREAVKWVAGVGPIGGILADDMGMGKTFMSIASIGARMRVQKCKMVLVIAPVSVVSGWVEEGNKFLSRFVKAVRIVKVHGGTQVQRAKAVRNAWKNSTTHTPHVVVTSWGLACSVKTMKAFLPPVGHCWDYVILDEAHLIKNHASNRFKCCFKICKKPGTNRLLLTGTPFQNDTTELWSITHMATAGRVLGKLKDFNKEYGKPIRNARCRNATSYEQKTGAQANEALQATLQPYLLRRRKIDFLKQELPPKYEICVWVKPSVEQIQKYTHILKNNQHLATSVLSGDKSIAKKARLCAFQVLNQLRSLCGHPLRLLLSANTSSIVGTTGNPSTETDRTCSILHSALAQSDLKTLLRASPKLELVLHMIQGFHKDGLQTLLFSQSTQNLSVIQSALEKMNLNKSSNISVCRYDGSMNEKRRRDTVECFQNGLIHVLLLSTGAGGVGLTLTAASRVILYDPSWNPSQDAQAVDRAYRIGQTAPEVRVYRLFLAGSVEEKMYEKQVHKAGLATTIFTEQKHGTHGMMTEDRYFDKHELSQVFAKIPDGKRCALLDRFRQEGVGIVTDAHRHDLVRAHSSVLGISNHSTLYNIQKRKCAFGDVTTNHNPDEWNATKNTKRCKKDKDNDEDMSMPSMMEVEEEEETEQTSTTAMMTGDDVSQEEEEKEAAAVNRSAKTVVVDETEEDSSSSTNTTTTETNTPTTETPRTFLSLWPL